MVTFIETESGVVAARAGQREEHRVSVSRVQSFSWGREKSSGDGGWGWFDNNVNVLNAAESSI